MSALPDHNLVQLLEGVSDTVLITSLDGIVVFWNRGAQEVFGYTKEDMIGQHVGKLYPEHQRAAIAALRERVLAGERLANVELEEHGKEPGHVRIILLSLVPLSDRDGTVQWLAGIGKDITAAKTLHHQMLETKQLKTARDMMVALNHEMNQPLGVLSMLMQSGLKSGELRAGQLDLMLKQVTRMSDLLKKIQTMKKVKVTEYVRGETMVDLHASSEEDSL